MKVGRALKVVIKNVPSLHVPTRVPTWLDSNEGFDQLSIHTC